MDIHGKVTYSLFFDDYSEVEVNQLIENIPTKDLLQFIGRPILQLHKFGFDRERQIEYFQVWVHNLPSKILEKIDSVFKEKEILEVGIFDFIDNYSILKFIEIIILNHNILPPKKTFSPDEKLRIFKAYLYCVEKWMNLQYQDLDKRDEPITSLKNMITINIPFEEYFYLKEARTQLTKAKIFYQFCEDDENFSMYLEKFIEYYNFSNWSSYINYFFNMYYAFMVNPDKNIVVFDSSNSGNELKHILDEICIIPNEFRASDDFLGVRQRPLYKMDDDRYIILNMTFFMDKIYQGIQFDFFKLLSAEKLSFKGKVIDNVQYFFGIYGSEFTETVLFYKVLEKAFEKLRFRKIPGNQFKISGPPDYYFRDSNDIYIFEFKNSFLSSKVKNSFNFEIIEAALQANFVNRGVSQIVNTIEKIKLGEFEKIDKLKHHKIKFYPILVYMDYSLNTPGINYYLNSQFLELVSRKELNKSYSINNLVCIHLDEFILLQDIFNKRQIKFKDCIQDYYKMTNTSDENQFQTFNRYVSTLMQKNLLDFPRAFKEMIEKIRKGEQI